MLRSCSLPIVDVVPSGCCSAPSLSSNWMAEFIGLLVCFPLREDHRVTHSFSGQSYSRTGRPLGDFSFVSSRWRAFDARLMCSKNWPSCPVSSSSNPKRVNDPPVHLNWITSGPWNSGLPWSTSKKRIVVFVRATGAPRSSTKHVSVFTSRSSQRLICMRSLDETSCVLGPRLYSVRFLTTTLIGLSPCWRPLGVEAKSASLRYVASPSSYTDVFKLNRRSLYSLLSSSPLEGFSAS